MQDPDHNYLVWRTHFGAEANCSCKCVVYLLHLTRLHFRCKGAQSFSAQHPTLGAPRPLQTAFLQSQTLTCSLLQIKPHSPEDTPVAETFNSTSPPVNQTITTTTTTTSTTSSTTSSATTELTHSAALIPANLSIGEVPADAPISTTVNYTEIQNIDERSVDYEDFDTKSLSMKDPAFNQSVPEDADVIEAASKKMLEIIADYHKFMKYYHPETVPTTPGKLLSFNNISFSMTFQ